MRDMEKALSDKMTDFQLLERKKEIVGKEKRRVLYLPPGMIITTAETILYVAWKLFLRVYL